VTVYLHEALPLSLTVLSPAGRCHAPSYLGSCNAQQTLNDVGTVTLTIANLNSTLVLPAILIPIVNPSAPATFRYSPAWSLTNNSSSSLSFLSFPFIVPAHHFWVSIYLNNNLAWPPFPLRLSCPAKNG